MTIQFRSRQATRRTTRAIILALGIGAVFATMSALPARADDDHGNRGHHYGHDNKYGYGHGYGHDRYVQQRHIYRTYDDGDRERYSYGPPPVVYAPYAPPALEFVFPVR